MEIKVEQLKINGSIEWAENSIIATGKIDNDRFYFCANNILWKFSVSTENSIEWNPSKIINNEMGYFVKGQWDNKQNKTKAFEDAKNLILEACNDFLDYIKKSNKKYQYRFIAFIDILGFKNIVAKTSNNVVYFNKILKAIKDLRENFIDKSDLSKLIQDVFFYENPSNAYKTQITQISDCIIISKLAHIDGSLEDLVFDISLAIHILIQNGLLCRGSIAYGKVYHNRDYIIGPGYIKAYLGEQEEKYPVISFTNDVYKFGIKRRSKDKYVNEYFDQFIVSHTTGRYFIDYFNDLDGYIDVFEKPTTHYKRLKAIIVKGYKNAANDNIKEKYKWAILKFNNSNVVSSGHIKKIILFILQVVFICL